MRTQEEILKKIEDVAEEDFFGFMRGDLLGYLTYENARPFLKPEVTVDQWENAPNDRDSIVSVMLEYMPFAWEKANSCRGISAARSMQHYKIWTWMIGDEDAFGDLNDYEFYGKDNLVKICNHYGWDSSQWDDGVRVNSESDYYISDVLFD